MNSEAIKAILDDAIAEALILHTKIKGKYPADSYSPIITEATKELLALQEQAVEQFYNRKIQIPNVDFVQIVGISRSGGGDWRTPLYDLKDLPILLTKEG